MVTRGVSQPPFSFIFAEAPLILCKEDLENLKIFFAKYQRSWCLPLGREPSQEAFGWQRVCSFPPVQAGRTYPWNSNPLVTCRVCRERGQEAVSRAWWLGVFHSLHLVLSLPRLLWYFAKKILRISRSSLQSIKGADVSLLAGNPPKKLLDDNAYVLFLRCKQAAPTPEIRIPLSLVEYVEKEDKKQWVEHGDSGCFTASM